MYYQNDVAVSACCSEASTTILVSHATSLANYSAPDDVGSPKSSHDFGMIRTAISERQHESIDRKLVRSEDEERDLNMREQEKRSRAIAEKLKILQQKKKVSECTEIHPMSQTKCESQSFYSIVDNVVGKSRRCCCTIRCMATPISGMNSDLFHEKLLFL